MKTITAAAVGTNQETIDLTIFQRLAGKDKTVIADCLDAYGNFIWALAVKFTSSEEEAEAAAQEIFIDIWRYSERIHANPTDEDMLVSAIARRRLLTYLQ